MRKSEELLFRFQAAKTPGTVGGIRAALGDLCKAMTEHIAELEKKYTVFLNDTFPRQRSALEAAADKAMIGYGATQVAKTLLIVAAAKRDRISMVNYDRRQEYYYRHGGRQIDAARTDLDALQSATRASLLALPAYSGALSRVLEALSTDDMRLLDGASTIRRGSGAFDACLGELLSETTGLNKVLDLDDAYRKELPSFIEALKGPGEALLDLLDAYRTECRVEGLCDAAQALLDTPQEDSGELRSLLGELDEYRRAGRSDAADISAALEARIREVDAERVYRRACGKLQSDIESECAYAASSFRGISFWKDAGELAVRAQARADRLHNEDLYAKAKSDLAGNTIEAVTRAVELFEALGAWGDAKKYAQKAREQLAILNRKKRRKTELWVLACTLFLLALFVYIRVIDPAITYRRAVENCDAGSYAEGVRAFKELGDYKDARERYAGAIYLAGVELLDAGKTAEARQAFYDSGVDRLASGDFDGAYEAFTRAEDHADARQKACEARYRKGEKLLEEGEVEAAEAIFMELDGQEAAKELDVAGRLKDRARRLAEEAEKSGDTRRAAGLYLVAGEQEKADDLLRPFYEEGEKQLALGNRREALVAFKKARGYSDAVMRVARLRGMIYASDNASFALTEAGELLCCGVKFDKEVNRFRKVWKDAVRVVYEPFRHELVSLMSNGEIRRIKYNLLKNMLEYNDSDSRIAALHASASSSASDGGQQAYIVDIQQASYRETCRLYSDGTVRSSQGTDNWTDIIEVSAGKYHLAAGLRADGTAVCSMSASDLKQKRESHPAYALPDVSSWSDLIGVAALEMQGQVAGLKADGTVVCTDGALQKKSAAGRTSSI